MPDTPIERTLGARALIWARPERAPKGPAPSRSRNQIAAAAVTLADAEGMETVSMRKVAAALRIGAASLYGYVDSKDELYDLMVDWVDGEDGPPPPLSGNWRADLSLLAHNIRSSMLRHPWMASIAGSRPNFGPNSVAWTEHGLATMDGLGVSVDDMLVASEILQSFVRGFTSRELAEQQALQRSGVSAVDRATAVGSWVDSLLRTGNYPRFKRVVRDAELPHAENRQDTIFIAALGRVLATLLPEPDSATAKHREATFFKDDTGK